MKIVTILGARPQFIKAGSVSREIIKQKEKGKDIQEIIVHTGQHYDANMSDIFFDEMKIPKPDYYLGIGGKTHGAMTGRMIEKIEDVLIKEKPDWVLVYGDTNSTLAGAVAASKLHIKIAHIEAGLRSFNMNMPEEINRILTDRISSKLFCPTQSAIDNLKVEGVEHWNSKVYLSGDVMQDGALFYEHLADKPNELKIENDFVLSTIHRQDNTDSPQRLKSIIDSLSEIAEFKDVVIPLHPRTRKILEQSNIDISRLNLLEPVGYLNMVWLIKNASLILTDSGGLQKEAFFFKKPCITLRDETEWVELIKNKFNVLVGANQQQIIAAFSNFEFSNNYSLDLYGCGKASENIINGLLDDA